MIETDFHRREFADGEELALGLAEWTAERLRGSDCSARGRVAHRLRRQVAGSVL